MAIVNVTYGHFGSGKLYSYYDPEGKRRVGDEIVVKVTHPKSKKTYKTLAVIRSTHAKGSQGDKADREYLENKNIKIKSVSGGSQKQLPGYYKGWRNDAKARKDLEHEMQTLPGMTMESFLNVRRMIRRL